MTITKQEILNHIGGEYDDQRIALINALLEANHEYYDQLTKEELIEDIVTMKSDGRFGWNNMSLDQLYEQFKKDIINVYCDEETTIDEIPFLCS